ncbi:MAG: hypothetical protein ACXWPS_12765, partial [Ktedonobacteraceae bacterium]
MIIEYTAQIPRILRGIFWDKRWKRYMECPFSQTPPSAARREKLSGDTPIGADFRKKGGEKSKTLLPCEKVDGKQLITSIFSGEAMS